MGDANVRRPVATRFEHGVDFGLLVHKSPFMADKRDPLVLSNYIFELLEVNPGVAGFLIQLHPDDVDAVVESVTAHAEKGAGTKTTLYVGQEEEEEEVEEEEEDAGGVGAGGRKEKPHNPLMISVQKVRIRMGKGKGKSDGWFPQPLTHNTRRVCTDDPENKLPMHSLCPTREWEREWYGVTTPNIVSGQGVILFPFGATPPLIGEAEEVVAAEPLGAFNRDPNDLVLTMGGKLVVNHLLEHDFLSDVQLQSLLDDLDRVPLSEKAPIFNENPPIVGRPQDSGTRRTLYGNYGGTNHHKHNPHKLHDLPVLKSVPWTRPSTWPPRGEEVEAMREALREAQEGRRKAEVDAAQLRVEVEGQRRRGNDLGQRLGVAEAHVRSLTSTLCASFGVQQAQQGLAPQGLQSQGSGSRSGSQ